MAKRKKRRTAVGARIGPLIITERAGYQGKSVRYKVRQVDCGHEYVISGFPKGGECVVCKKKRRKEEQARSSQRKKARLKESQDRHVKMKQAAKLIKGGETVASALVKVGLPMSCRNKIPEYLPNSLKVRRPKREPLTERDYSRIRRMLKDGKSDEEICQKFVISFQHARTLRKRLT